MQTPEPAPEFPSYNEPLPPPPPPYGSGPRQPEGGLYGRPPRGPVISFDTIGEAWSILSANLGIWVAAVLVYNIAVSVPIMIGYAALIGSVIQQVQANPSAPPQLSSTFWITYALCILVSGVISIFMFAGLMRMAIDNVRTGHVSFGRLFSATDVLPSLLGASILMALAYFGGVVLCIIPGLLLMSLFTFVFPLILEKKMGAFQAISTSFEMLKSQMWMALAHMLVISIISQAGVLLCGIGFLITFPLFVLCIAVTYRDFYPEGAIPDYRPQAAQAPLADPNG